MKIFNARVAIYCDVEIEVPESFDYENFKSEELDVLFDQVFENTPELYDPKAGRVVNDYEYEVLSIWDEEKDISIYEGC
jgi:hypothetical protein